ncbi:alpha-amylase family protein [uncultured Victivallis sp.]|uniref:alpha-amylase family protein n=1 Tax=uncultured Victivallis sp. TaxID=354118 RepID=UPI0025CFBDF0|nr:alpha-amylase family protein [uncultured Victivallis sp.]
MSGSWYGDHCNIGMHYDLHARKEDTVLGTRVDDTLAELLGELDVDFVQTDCKGHPGVLSWFSNLPGSTMPPGLRRDALAGWREQTRKLGLPLHCHYSGIWDKAAGARFPDWHCQLPPEAQVGSGGQNVGTNNSQEIMCPNRGYVDGLMIPQMSELIERYGVDGFWVDGDLWAVRPCYCDRCRARFCEETGLDRMPVSEEDPNWYLVWNFMLRSFKRYVRHYCDEIHRRYPGVKICSNWLQTYRNPGEPDVPTDWISGDNAHHFGLDTSRCEARFLETRNKPWDIMLWTFTCNNGFALPESPWVFKPAEMLEQEIAVLLSCGGNIQLYETSKIRDGRLVPWRIRRLRKVVDFIRERLPVCKRSRSIPQVAVLHSEVHFYRHVTGVNLMTGGDITPVDGAVMLLLENHFHTDLCDEWALLPRLAEYPVVVVPEQYDLSEKMAEALRQYVAGGGCLVLTGSEIFDRFGAEFIGAESVKVERDATWFVPDASDGATPLFSRTFRLLKPSEAEGVGELYRLGRVGDDGSGFPAATVLRKGRGVVAYIPAAICHDFAFNREIGIREFFGSVVRSAACGRLAVECDGPSWVDLSLRRSGENEIQIHLINRSTGIPNLPNQGVVAEIPPVGPLTIRLRMEQRPDKVVGAWERVPGLEWEWHDGILTVRLPQLRLYEAILVNEPGRSTC